MNYFDFLAKQTSWDVVEMDGIQVSERELTDEEIEKWTQTVSEPFKPTLYSEALLPPY